MEWFRDKFHNKTWRDLPPEWRTVYGNTPAQFVDNRDKFNLVDNVVITSNYTVANFVPKFLFMQFSRFANAYFLFVSILQLIPDISITGGIPSVLGPLAFVLAFDAVVTAMEDYKRHKDDYANNSRAVEVCRDGAGFTVRTWADVQVGDILKIYRGDGLCADVLFLRSFCNEDSDPSSCYVQTAQLDGETNLKLRQALAGTVSHFVDDQACSNFKGMILAEPPNGYFGKFTGSIQLDPAADKSTGIPVGADNLLLRGCVLRNVDFVYGMVVYTGDQTKVRVKQREKQLKQPSLEALINKHILGLVALLCAFCVTGTIGYAAWLYARYDKHTYLGFASVDGVDVFIKLFTFFLLNTAFIPVSLYVSMKMARTGQQFFMEQDVEVYHEDAKVMERSGGTAGAFPLKVRSMDLNDELGQVSHIFSDKTGTFTLNYMELRKLCIRGVPYGLGTTEIGLDRLHREGVDTTELEAQMQAAVITVPHVNFIDGCDLDPARTLAGDRANGAPDVKTGIHDFMLHLVLNHTVVPEEARDHTGQVVGRELSASSPDEEAFVYAGEFLGYRFESRKQGVVELIINGEKQLFTLLHIFAYTNARKRMTIIAQHPDGSKYLYLKGADSKVFERLAPFSGKEGELFHTTDRILQAWGNDGLRTLCFAYKRIDDDEYALWNRCFSIAQSKLEEVKKMKAGQPNEIDRLMDLMETDLILQGATANEDKLQPGVPETIAQLASGSVKIWMLTGDKEETAMNIGYATRMLTDQMRQVVLSSSVATTPEEFFKRLMQEAQRAGDASAEDADVPVALVIDEHNIDLALDPKNEHFDQKHKDALLKVSKDAKAVICCRARPDQKAALVQLIKEGVPGVRTLAIGDGANDVDMIQMAHVGVGIAGAEGVQAANASDYAIGRFRFLLRLLLVHGRWNYRRMSKLVCYMFYKNIAMVLCQFWFTILAGWSGQKFYIELAAQAFNLVFTGAPVLILALLDQDVPAHTVIRFPILFRDGIDGREYNHRVFIGWVLQAVVDSIICFCIPVFAIPWAESLGVTPTVFDLGTVCLTAIILVTSVRIALEMQAHSLLFQIILFLSVVSWIPYLFIMDALNADRSKGIAIRLLSNGTFWFVQALCVVMCAFRPLAWKVWQRYFHTEFRHLVQEAYLFTFNDRPLVKYLAELRRKTAAVTHVVPATPIVELELTATPTSPRKALSSRWRKLVTTTHVVQRLSSHRGFGFSVDEPSAELIAQRSQSSAADDDDTAAATPALSALEFMPSSSDADAAAAYEAFVNHRRERDAKPEA